MAKGVPSQNRREEFLGISGNGGKTSVFAAIGRERLSCDSGIIAQFLSASPAAGPALLLNRSAPVVLPRIDYHYQLLRRKICRCAGMLWPKSLTVSSSNRVGSNSSTCPSAKHWLLLPL